MIAFKYFAIGSSVSETTISVSEDLRAKISDALAAPQFDDTLFDETVEEHILKLKVAFYHVLSYLLRIILRTSLSSLLILIFFFPVSSNSSVILASLRALRRGRESRRAAAASDCACEGESAQVHLAIDDDGRWDQRSEERREGKECV